MYLLNWLFCAAVVTRPLHTLDSTQQGQPPDGKGANDIRYARLPLSPELQQGGGRLGAPAESAVQFGAGEDEVMWFRNGNGPCKPVYRSQAFFHHRGDKSIGVARSLRRVDCLRLRENEPLVRRLAYRGIVIVLVNKKVFSDIACHSSRTPTLAWVRKSVVWGQGCWCRCPPRPYRHLSEHSRCCEGCVAVVCEV